MTDDVSSGSVVDCIAAAIWDELEKQRKESFGPYVDRSMGDIDGEVNMLAVAAAVADALEDARTITTTEHLDALPFLSVVREIFRTSPSGADYGGLYERRTSGWHPVAGVYKGAADNGFSPKLPCRFLWVPAQGGTE